MFSVAREAVPDDALLRTFRGGTHPERWGHYADCFGVGVDRKVTLDDFVFAFYTSHLFRIERFLLRALINAPSSRSDARAVADGTVDHFAAWYVGQRTATQLLMCDRYERTRSWFRIEPESNGGTHLQFGSAVAAKRREQRELPQPATPFGLLLSFHVMYSQALLGAAKKNLSAA